MRFRVTAAHVAPYLDPIAAKAGDVLVPDGREELWDRHRWVWARGPAGREGWIPDNPMLVRHAHVVAARDSCAAELDVAAGEVVEVVDATHGWSWCRRADGREGSIPDRKLVPC